MRNIGRILLGFGLSATLSLTGLAVGCGGDDNPTPVDPTKTDTGTATDTGGTDTGTTPTDTGTKTDAPTDAPTDGPVDAPWDPDSGTCFPGKPTKTVEFLNACTKADKLPAFDKKKLTKLKSDGTRPALP